MIAKQHRRLDLKEVSAAENSHSARTQDGERALESCRHQRVLSFSLFRFLIRSKGLEASRSTDKGLWRATEMQHRVA